MFVLREICENDWVGRVITSTNIFWNVQLGINHHVLLNQARDGKTSSSWRANRDHNVFVFT